MQGYVLGVESVMRITITSLEGSGSFPVGQSRAEDKGYSSVLLWYLYARMARDCSTFLLVCSAVMQMADEFQQSALMHFVYAGCKNEREKDRLLPTSSCMGRSG